MDARLAPVRARNFADAKSVGGGVSKLPISFDPGLRVHYGIHGRQIVVLLGGGDKGTQVHDIRRAQHQSGGSGEVGKKRVQSWAA